MKDTIRMAGIIRESIVDGPGLRMAIFCQGCAHACKGCHNPETWDFKGGYDSKIENIIKAIDEDPLLDGVTFSGGDPMYQPEAFYELAKQIKERKLNILIYTGFTYEELLEMGEKDHYVIDLLKLTDTLIDGKFELDNRDISLLFRGSKNQRIIDVQASLKQGKVVLDERYN